MSEPSTTRELVDLTIDECLERLGSSYIGRLGFIDADGRPQILPLNFRLADGAVVFRTTYGTMLDTVHGADVVFEVDDYDLGDHTGWSVLVHGRAEEVWVVEDLEEVRDLPLRPWAPGDRDHYVRIRPSSMTGRRIGTPDPDS